MTGFTKKYRLRAQWFDNEELHQDLKGKSIKGGISTSASQFIRFGLNMVSTFVLARILLPSDFGIVGMVTAFTGFAGIIQDMGLSTAVIQKEKITHRQVSNLFWINIIICLILGILFALISPLIVSLYHHDHRLYPIILSYAASIAISGLSIQHNALMNRKMLFSTLAKGEILATLLSVVCGIIAGLMGMGYWAIIILNISGTIFNICFMWVLCNWRPSLPERKQSVKGFLRFGAGISGFNIINYFSRNSDDILIGSLLGPAAVGFYSKAFQLLMLPLNQLRNPLLTVALPAMSSLKNNTERYINYYKKYVFVLSFFSMPVIAYLALFSHELILIVLGHQWEPSSMIFRGLAIAGFIQPAASSIGLVMISTGQSKRYFVWGCINASVTIIGFLIGIHWGMMGIVYSLAITTYCLLLPSLWFAFRGTPLRILVFFQEILLPLLHTLALLGILFGIHTWLENSIPSILLFILSTALGVCFYYFSWKLYPMGREKTKTIEEVLNIATQRFNGMETSLNKIFHLSAIVTGK